MKTKSNKANAGLGIALAIAAVAGVLVSGQSADAAVRHGHAASSAAWADTQYRDSQSGPFPERELSNGTFTGPLDRSANGG